jgi:hypothetical protein
MADAESDATCAFTTGHSVTIIATKIIVRFAKAITEIAVAIMATPRPHTVTFVPSRSAIQQNMRRTWSWRSAVGSRPSGIVRERRTVAYSSPGACERAIWSLLHMVHGK